MPRYYAFEIKVEGRRYTGDWSLHQGSLLCVRSAWGGVTVEIGQDEPKSAAQLTLERIVRAYRQAQLDELDRQAREMAKISRRVRRKPKAEAPD